LQGLFNEGKFLFKGKKIPIARIDVSKKETFLEKDDIIFESVPRIVIVKYDLIRVFICIGIRDSMGTMLKWTDLTFCYIKLIEFCIHWLLLRMKMRLRDSWRLKMNFGLVTMKPLISRRVKQQFQR
jgi:hypothetical protein